MKNLKFIPIMLGALAAVFLMYEIVDADTSTGSKYEPFVVNSTAYCNPHGNLTASGKPTVEGITLAAKEEWIGCVAVLYEIKEDGGIGDYIDTREITDTGFGVASKQYKGMGTIESGETVDLYFTSYDEAIKWGNRRIYIQIVPGKG